MVLDFHLNFASIVSIQGGESGMPFQGATDSCMQNPRHCSSARVAGNSPPTCFAGEICWSVVEVQICRCELGLICSRGSGAAPPGAQANLRKLAVRNSPN